jgi:uncharacterized protein YgiM (DUF1202 family)
MRKPLVALGLALSTGLGVMPGAAVLAATTASSPSGTKYTTSYSPPSPPQNTRPVNAISGAAIVQFAMKYIGYPYTATGNSPSTGFSCIGFVSYVYRSLGIRLPGNLGDALAFAPQVPFSDLEPGDILYFQNTVWNGLSHAAIYIGGGRFIHAEWYGKGVRISSFNNDTLDGNYWISKYLGANRPWSGAAVAPVVGIPSSPPGVGASKTPGVSTAQAVVANGTAGVTKASLNVRSGPSKQYAVQTVLGQGASVSIVGRVNGWYKIQLPNGTIGYVEARYVSKGTVANPSVAAQVVPNPPLANATTPSAPRRAGVPPAVKPGLGATGRRPTAQVRANGLRVHSTPSVNASVVTSIAAGERVQILARINGWMKVRTASGQVGWIVASYTNKPVAATRSTAVRNTSAQANVRPRTPLTGPTTTVKASGLRVHSTPSLNGAVVTSIPAGQRVQILARINGWMKVRTAGGYVGWIVASYTRAARGSTAAGSTVAAKSSSYRSGPTLTAGVRVHASPGLRSRVTTVAAAGTHVTVLGYHGAWMLVRLPSGQTGYVYASYVRR